MLRYPEEHQRVVKVTLFSISRFPRGPFSCAKDNMIHCLRWTVFLWVVNSTPFASGMTVNERIGMYAVTKRSAPRCLLILVCLQKVWLEAITSVWFFEPCSFPRKRSMLTSPLWCRAPLSSPLISALFKLSCLESLYANELFVMKDVVPSFKKQGLLHGYLKFLLARTWRQALDLGGISQKPPRHIRSGVMCPIELLYWLHSD